MRAGGSAGDDAAAGAQCDTTGQRALEHALTDMVRTSPALMQALVAVRTLGLVDWCIGAGAVRSLVWDRLHGFQTPTPLSDIDVVYFDAAADPARDAELEGRLRRLLPGLRWEVSNQAHIHHWFRRALGQRVAALVSLEDGVATWPEYATCVGVRLNGDGTLAVIAPHGLDDLFALRVRHNDVRAGAEVYRQRVLGKRFAERWPRLSIDPPA
jgi:hypothetical protein